MSDCMNVGMNDGWNDGMCDGMNVGINDSMVWILHPLLYIEI